ncbi:MAG: TonB-dependent receptor [Bacteroidota bacterium]
MIKFYDTISNGRYLFSLLIMLGIFCSSVSAQTITGTVTGDTEGIGLIGVNILEKGTANGAVSDFDGNFTISVNSPDAVLVFSYTGYITQEINVNNRTSVDVLLKEDITSLDQVVVVGFGAQKKATVVGSVTQAKGEELVRAGSVPTLSEALTGTMPGITTMQAAGQPGSTQSNILIRGQSTWAAGGNSPLFLVDGVERDFNDLDPNEVETITVLKDASATAVFGVKAANGVILVTTKRGSKGKAKVNYSMTFGIKEPTMNTDYYADYPTTLENFNIAAMNDRDYGRLVPQSLIDTWRDPNRDRDFYTYTTWINELLTNGTAQQHNLNISGGNDFVSYFTSFGYQFDGDIFDMNKQEDFDPRTYQRRYTWRTNLDFNFSKSTQFKVGLYGNFKNWNGNVITQGTNNGIRQGNGDSFTRIWQTPLIGPTPILDDGRLTTEQGAVVQPNFRRMEREGQWSRRSNTLYTDFTLSQEITKHFRASAKFSYNALQGYQNVIRQNVLFYFPNGDNTDWIQEGDPNLVAPPPVVQAENIRESNNSLYYEVRLNYNQSFGNHNVSAMGLFNRRRAQNGVQFPRFEESWVGRATYGYKNKYLLEFNGAYNGNENWAPGFRFGFFPSLAGGWVISEEDFVKDNLPFLEFLKIRYSYGEIGSDQGIGNNRFIYLSQYETSPNNGGSGEIYYGDPIINYGAGGVLIEGAPAVLNNTWETSVKQDLALEFAVLKDRLQGSIEFFDEKRQGILMQRRTVAPWFGNQAPFANIGETKNHGIDFELKWFGTIGRNVDYFLRGNVSLTESRIINRDDPPNTVDHQKEAGKPIGWQSAFLENGLYQSWDDVYNSTASLYSNDLKPGQFEYVDYNGDGIINDFDRVPIKDPSFMTKSFAFSFGFNYKGFGFHAMFNGAFGIAKALDNIYLYEYESAGSTQWQLINNEQRDAWSFDNPNGVHPALSVAGNDHDTQLSTYSYREADFLRLRSLEVKYNFGQSLRDKIRIFNSLELFVNGNNLLTWSNLPDEFDPEQQSLRVYPITKRYNFGLRASL